VPGGDVTPAAVEDYLATVAAGLIGPRRWRSEVIAELRDGLVEATQAHRVSAGSLNAAAAAAVTEFGPPEPVLAGLIPIGAGGLARQVVVGLLASGPVAASVWVAAMAGSGNPPWQGGLAGSWRLLPWVGVVLGIVVVAAVLVLLVTGRPGYRWGTRNLAKLEATQVSDPIS
jgi:MFS family permease